MTPAPRFSAQELEALILKEAAKCIAATSLLDFTMDAIAQGVGVSKGSVYKHVQSKEDVLLALATQMFRQQYKVFSELMNLPLTMPERLISILLICPDKLYFFPFGAHLNMLIGNDAVLRRAGPNWLERLVRLDQMIGELFQNALKNSWESNELQVSKAECDRAIETLNLSLWSLSVGFHQVTYENQAWNRGSDEVELPFPLTTEHVLVGSARAIINSVPWDTPLDRSGIARVCNVLTELGYR